ncbi:MAG TPA: type II CAAX endopeptidase family protein [Pseudonocardiaceae bacterium]
MTWSAAWGRWIGTVLRSRVTVFFLLAYAISWAWLVPWVIAGQSVRQGSGWPTHVPALLGPLLAALIMTAATTGRSGLRELAGRLVRWRIGWRWWLAALGPLVFLLATLAVLAAGGAGLPAPADFAEFSGLPAAWGPVGVAVALLLVDGLGEEGGWRGYALPRLSGRLGPVAASLIIAVLWAGWHLPQFLLLDSYRGLSPAMVPVFLVGLAAGSIVLTWLYNRTGSVAACAVWHTGYNLASGTAAAGAGGGMIAVAVWGFVVVSAVVLLVMEWRARRAGRPAVLGRPSTVTV